MSTRTLLAPLLLVACHAGGHAGDTHTHTHTDTDTDTDTDADTDTDTDTDAPAPCQVLGDDLPDAGMSIWMTDPTDVWIVGADGSADPGGPMMLHYDGNTWTDLEPGVSGKLQWLWSDGGDEIVAVGLGAQVVRYSRSADTFTSEVIADTRYTLWGVWGPSANDLWAAAGDGTGNLNGAIFHYDGTAWTLAYTAPSGQSYQLFKVWGAAADDVWAVGSIGLLVHYDGTSWTQVPQPNGLQTSMFTVHGTAEAAIAVGGFSNAVAWYHDGTGWAEDSPPPATIAPNLVGTYTSETFGTVACGRTNAIWWREDANVWTPDPRLPVPTLASWSFHACWVDPMGGVWAVGGNIDSPALDHGEIVYCGPETIHPL